MSEWLEKIKAERSADAKRWDSLSDNICQVCNTKGEDRRTLFISCLYSLKEVSPLFIDLFETPQKERGFALRICKGCRARLLGYLQKWVQEQGRVADSHLDDDGIYGYSKEEWQKLREKAKL
jgi:hypothetical protein